MAKKLTLSMDEAVIEAAKKYVEQQGISLSSYIESFLKNTTGISSHRKEKQHTSTPHMDKIRELRKKMRSEQEQKEYLSDLYNRKPYMKEWFEMKDQKYGY